MHKLTEGSWQDCLPDRQGLHFCELDGGGDIGILILHPISLHSGWITRTVRLFGEQGFKVWALDLPVHGKNREERTQVRGFSRITSGKLSWAAHFDVLEAAERVLGFAVYLKAGFQVQYLVIGGLSFGGMVAPRFLCKELS